MRDVNSPDVKINSTDGACDTAEGRAHFPGTEGCELSRIRVPTMRSNYCLHIVSFLHFRHSKIRSFMPIESSHVSIDETFQDQNFNPDQSPPDSLHMSPDLMNFILKMQRSSVIDLRFSNDFVPKKCTEVVKLILSRTAKQCRER
jgi:hypothetical protein